MGSQLVEEFLMEYRTRFSRYLMAVVAFMLIAVMFITLVPTGTQAYSDTDTLDEDYYATYPAYGYLGGSSGDKFSIEFTVTGGNKADIYIMTSTEYNKYTNLEDFNTSFMRENTSSVPKTT